MQHPSKHARGIKKLLSFMFCGEVAHPCLKSLTHAAAQQKSKRGRGGWLSWKHCLSWWHCPHCDRRFFYDDRWNEKQPILILHQSAIIYEPNHAAPTTTTNPTPCYPTPFLQHLPPPVPLSLSLQYLFPSLSHLLFTAPILKRQTSTSLKESPAQTQRKSCL